LLIVATAERGLCGGFNASIARMARDEAEALKTQGKTVRILCVGRKGYDILKRNYSDELLAPVSYQGLKSIGFTEAQNIATQVLDDFEAGVFDVCTLYYSAFQSVIAQIPTALQLIPAQIEDAETPDLGGAAYDYEPEETEILDALLPRNISIQILRAFLENAASEQGARMSAMDNATRNAGEMIDSLTITYNRSRQAQITKELIEIISGAEAL
jgi:F-type H+-transporting ATPase subunit gamma